MIMTTSNKPKIIISGPGIFSVTSEELLKSDKIRKQYEMLRDPSIRKILFK